ncbi:MAG TPA: helix-turn-helix transcriptional regulator [Rhizomicrobium sp.]|nr:helix-turn-helix transcriptional regulator [Rhizomicrobium sp.]
MSIRHVDEQLVQHLYGTAVDTGDWRPALGRFCQLLDSCEAGFTMTAGGPDTMSMVETTGRLLTPELIDLYVRHYGRFDPKLAILAENAPGYLLNDARHFDEQFVSRDLFYQEYTRQVGTRHTLHMLAKRSASRQIYLAVMRSRRPGPYQTQAEIVFRQSSSHFVRALSLMEKVDCLRRAGDALDGLDFGIVVVDSFHRVALLNRMAEDLLAERGELQMNRGILSARRHDTDRRLKALIDSAVAGHAEGGVLEIRDAAGTGLAMRTCPLPAGSRIAAQRSPAVLIIIGGAKRRPGRADLSALYDLTEAESRLALAIAEGRTLASIAALHGVKYSTVRSQLQSVMQKMGVRRQADVVRLLASN